MAINQFSNRPQFCTQVASVGDCLSLPVFDALAEANPNTSSSANCNDKLEGALWRKNVVNKAIKCGGKNIDINWFMDMYGLNPLKVDSTTIYNHYICDINYNIQPAASRTAAGKNQAVWFQLSKSNHSGSYGQFSYPQKGFLMIDKDRQIQYTIVNVDTSIPYAHKVQIVPNDENVTASVSLNTSYLIVDANLVGGYSCPTISNGMQTLGYVQEVNPIRVRKDWCVQIALERGYKDVIQFPVIYDRNGRPTDSWEFYETQNARDAVRKTINVLSFIGSPTTNQDVLSQFGMTTDDVHTGYYGMLNNIKYGGGIVQDFDPAVGYDLDADFEPLALYQDSLKRSTRFLVTHGKAWRAGVDRKTNKLVKAAGTGSLEFENYRRAVERMDTANNPASVIQKLGISGYEYLGFGLDFKEIGAFSDYRYMGSDYTNNLAIFQPMDGVTQNGQEINSLEFYQYGGIETGGYQEFRWDNRTVNGCESFQGYVVQAIAMAMHCMSQWVLANPVKAC